MKHLGSKLALPALPHSTVAPTISNHQYTATNGHNKPNPSDESCPSTLRFIRKVIGILGILFPFILLFGAMLMFKTGIQPTISHYYHTDMRDVFVGILCAIALALLSYRGYDQQDNWIANAAFFCALGVAWLPTTALCDPTASDSLGCTITARQRYIGIAHLVCASTLFLLLAYFSLCLFTKTHSPKRDALEKRNLWQKINHAAQRFYQCASFFCRTLFSAKGLIESTAGKKRRRNQIYIICGRLIVGAIVFIALLESVSLYFPDNSLVTIPFLVFSLESFAVFAFGFAWLIKSQWIPLLWVDNEG